MSAKEEAIAAATASLKKILSSKGSLQGNFYAYVSKTESALAVTLVARDPKGAKALNYGRALKKEIPRGKFLRGTVNFDKDSKKIVFVPGPGNLSGNALKKHLKTGFDDAGLMRFTKRARIDMDLANALKESSEREVVVDDSEAITDEEIKKLGESKEEINDLIELQEELGALHQSLGAFLMNQTDEGATRELIQSSVEKITALKDQSAGLNTFAIESELTELVGFTRVGDDPFGGDALPPEIDLLMEHAGTLMNERSTEAENTYQRQLAPIFQKVEKILAATGAGLLKKAVQDHNIKVPNNEAEDHRTLASGVDGARYAAAREALYKTFIPPDRESLADGSWEKGFLQRVSDKGAKELEKVTLAPELGQLEANANQQRNLAFDTDTNTTDPYVFHTTICGTSWETVKKKLSENAVLMWQMVLYRKRTVDGFLAEQRTNFPNLIAKSVGSQNLTSDYDLTLSTTDGSGDEIQAVKNFNDRVKERYNNRQPGVVFDTNLYAKDFLKVKDTVFNTNSTDPGDIAEVKRYLEMDRSNQDVAALTKMRQYMNQQEWTNYREDFLDDPATLTQLDEADAKYHIKLNTVLNELSERYHQGVTSGQLAEHEDINRQLTQLLVYKTDADRGDVAALAKYQRLTEALIDAFNEHFDNLTLETRNDLYLEKMKGVRSVQRLHSRMQEWITTEVEGLNDVTAQVANLDEQDEENARKAALQIVSAHVKDRELVALLASDITRFITLAKLDPTGAEARKYLFSKIDALKEEARRKLGEANYYAAEAYLSEGPLQHIVNGNQSDNPEVFAKLKPEHFLESINEQTGDFFKDVDHHKADRHKGVAFYQTAKYLQRMFEGIVKLSLKDGFEDIESEITMPGGWGSAEQMMQRIDSHFMPIRGSKGEYATMDEAAKSQAALDKLPTVYGGGVTTIGDLKAAVMALSKSINAAVRKMVQMRPDAPSGAQTVGMQTGV